jgi:hypothetical protein
MDWLENRPTLTPKGIQALCNAVMLMDKTLSSRPAIIEECARVCDEQYEKHKHYFSVGPGLATACATAIRALAPGGQNAAYTAAAGYPLEAQSRAASAEVAEGTDLRQQYKNATPEERQRLIHEHDCPKAWAFYDKHAIGLKPCPSCLACGKQEPDPSKWAIKHMELPNIYICETCATALRAAPSLSREEWKVILLSMEFYDDRASVWPAGWEALRAKVREARK